MGEKAHLVTQNLIGAVRWAIEAPHTVIKEDKGGDGKTTWSEKALQDLSDTLNRIPGDFPEAARRGVEFEKKVYAVANNDSIGGSIHFQKVCSEVKGFSFGKKGGITKDIEGYKCYLYAKYDAVKEKDKEITFIKDIKTTGSYKKNKYVKGVQHKLYCYITKCKDFEYIIAEWDEYPKIKDIHIEKFRVNNFDLLELEINREIIECFEAIKEFGLWEAYREKYCLY